MSPKECHCLFYLNCVDTVMRNSQKIRNSHCPYASKVEGFKSRSLFACDSQACNDYLFVQRVNILLMISLQTVFCFTIIVHFCYHDKTL